ncbi:hypothetical protein ARTSIC4J27_2859 [Pseudarthrobacter siccitolerans]|uniref:Uncharacterized protein n=1 Tax=Pseudarthrobacter siccitolerans TaxID=861266 RepID=A0A024H4F8_9MICC|nr:hypothetical protein ARTSIC4J27_2859 [Pseudarthrobacter siccitolerans]
MTLARHARSTAGRACHPAFCRTARSSPGAPHRGWRVAGQRAGA